MSILTVFILSSLPCSIVEAIYIRSPVVIGKIDPKTLLKHDSITLRNTTKSYLNITELAKEYGYLIEEHKVTTEDGYILGLHRLKSNLSRSNNIPVFLMHGLLDSSESWILQGRNALGYLLIDKGFDVWMGNARGNRYSTSHTDLSSNQEKFWEFSWEEIGLYDLPAMTDYVLNATNTKSMYYIGHSQGTTSFFVMSSLKPEYRSKIKAMFALSPITWLSHATSPMLRYISTIPAAIIQYFQFTVIPSDFLYQIYANMCKVVTNGCGNIFEMVFGVNYFVKDAMLPVIVEHASTSSVKQFVHYWQLYQSGRFCRFDYGWMRNLLVYGRFSPPDYELGEINVPIVLFFSSNDWLSHPSDVEILKSHLPNVSVSYHSQYFSHIDYLYASVAKVAVYDKIIKHIYDYERR